MMPGNSQMKSADRIPSHISIKCNPRSAINSENALINKPTQKSQRFILGFYHAVIIRNGCIVYERVYQKEGYRDVSRGDLSEKCKRK
jgi:hypothetical protein